MTYFEYYDRVETLKRLAEKKQTGSPLDLAKKFNVSERSIFRMVQQLRDHSYPIVYNRFLRTYEIESS